MYLERVRLVEDTALKAAGGKTFAGSIPVLSVFYLLRDEHILDNGDITSIIANV